MVNKKIFHIDDSGVQLKLCLKYFNEADSSLVVEQFYGPQAVIEKWEANPNDLPWVIFTDYMMPGMTGAEFLSWIKRHPRYHIIPVIIISAEADTSTIQETKDLGAFAYLNKPIQIDKLKEALKLREGFTLEYSEFQELNKAFFTAAIEQIELIRSLKNNLDDNTSKEMLRILHTMKGESGSLQFLELSHWIHSIEDLMKAIRDGNMFSFNPALELLEKSVQWLETQIENLNSGKLMELQPKLILDEIKRFNDNVKQGWKISDQTTSSTPVATVSSTSTQKKMVISSSSVRIANELLDELHKKFKKILQLRTRLNSFANEIKSEFPDELFPRSLSEMIEELNLNGMDLLEFFISLRLVPASRLETYCKHIIQQTSQTLGKNVAFDFRAPKDLEIDKFAIEILENGLLHLIRNSIDHGIESEDERKQKGKNLIGQMTLIMDVDKDDILRVALKDDGKGINLEKLKKSILDKGIINAENLNKLSLKEVYDLIFVDGVSTKQEVTEVSGRGVGLSAVREAIEKSGGKIDVVSSPEGTSFLIRIPRVFKL